MSKKLSGGCSPTVLLRALLLVGRALFVGEYRVSFSVKMTGAGAHARPRKNGQTAVGASDANRRIRTQLLSLQTARLSNSKAE